MFIKNDENKGIAGFSVRIPKHWKELIDKECTIDRRSLNQMINFIIEAGVKALKLDDKHGVKL